MRTNSLILAIREMALVAAVATVAVTVAAVVTTGDSEIVGGVALIALLGLPGPIFVRAFLGGRRSKLAVHVIGGAVTLTLPLLLAAMSTLPGGDGAEMALFCSGIMLGSGMVGYVVAIWRAANHPLQWTGPAERSS